MAKNTVTGTTDFPAVPNDIYSAIETIGAQEIRAMESSNELDDALYFYDVENGETVESIVIPMAESQAFDKNNLNFAAVDPDFYVKYYKNYEKKQYEYSVRRDELRKILLKNGGNAEDVAGMIISGITNGEGYEEFCDTRDLILTAPTFNYAQFMGNKVPATMKGVVWALRDMYNHVKSTNDDLTEYKYMSSCPAEDVRVAVTTKLLNLIDVVELANVFNLTKEELFGRLVVVNVDDMDESPLWYRAVVYDRKALCRARRLYEFTQFINGSALYVNYYLTTDKAFFYNSLFKATYLDCSVAAAAALEDITSAPATVTVTGAGTALTGLTQTNAATTTAKNAGFYDVLTKSSAWASSKIKVTMVVTGSSPTDVTEQYVTATDTGFEINIPVVTGNIVISLVA